MIEMQVESQVVHSRWGLAIGEDRHSPVIVRYLQDLPPNDTRRRYSELMRIQWEYESMMANGMPTRDQSHQMDIFEGGLLRSLEQAGKGLLAAIVTQEGIREWLIYVTESKMAEKLVEKLAESVEDGAVTIDIQADSSWRDLSELIDTLAD